MKKLFKNTRVRLSTGRAPPGTVWQKDLPFRRSWKLILFVLLLDAALLVPLFLTLSTAVDAWVKLDSQFDLVTAIFHSAWLLGWSIAPLILSLLLIVLVLGREKIMARPGIVDLTIGLPGLMVLFELDAAKMRNIRQEVPATNSGKTWRGPHLAFDYEDRIVSIGSDIGPVEVEKMIGQLALATGVSIPAGERVRARTVQDIKNSFMSKRIQAMQTMPEEGDESGTNRLFSLSTLILVLANLVPVAGAVYFGWDLSSVLVIYWAESGIIGFYNLCKMLVIGGWAGLFPGIFFIGHFGAFMAIHFMFIYELFIQGGESSSSIGLSEAAQYFKQLWPALLALFISHGISFYQNFLGRREYKNKTLGDQMHEPYKRIIFMQFVIIAGAGLTGMLGDTTVVLLLIMLAKIAVDVWSHVKERV